MSAAVPMISVSRLNNGAGEGGEEGEEAAGRASVAARQADEGKRARAGVPRGAAHVRAGVRWRPHR
jgi:hypothetical protein